MSSFCNKTENSKHNEEYNIYPSYSTTKSTKMKRNHQISDNSYFSTTSSPNMKNQLESEIKILEAKQEELKNNSSKIKQEQISQGELSIFTTETRTKAHEYHNERIKSILNQYFKSIRSISKLKAQCFVLEQEISEETERRRTLLNESETISSLFNFSTNPQQIEFQYHFESKEDQRMKETRNNLEIKYELILSEIKDHSSLQIIKEMTEKAASLYSSSTQKAWELRSIPIIYYRLEVDHLSQLCKEIDNSYNKSHNEFTHKKKSILSIDIETQQIESDFKTRLDEKKLIYDNNIELLQKIIYSLKDKINHTAKQFDEINLNIESLQIELKNTTQHTEFYTELNSYEEEEEISEQEFNSESTDNEISEYLNTQKENLENEIIQINNQINETIRIYKINERKFKKEIQDLRSRYINNNSQLKRNHDEYIISKRNLNDDTLRGNILELLDSISSTVHQLKTNIID